MISEYFPQLHPDRFPSKDNNIAEVGKGGKKVFVQMTVGRPAFWKSTYYDKKHKQVEMRGNCNRFQVLKVYLKKGH